MKTTNGARLYAGAQKVYEEYTTTQEPKTRRQLEAFISDAEDLIRLADKISNYLKECEDEEPEFTF